MEKDIVGEVNWFITGTAAYGPLRPGSAIDIVCSSRISEDMKKWAESRELAWYQHNEEHTYEDDPEEVWYLELPFTRINFIVLTAEKYEQWKHATEVLKKQSPIADRSERIHAFEMACIFPVNAKEALNALF